MGLYNYELYLKGKSQFIGYGYVMGELYTLKERSYPALLPGNSSILGEIYEVPFVEIIITPFAPRAP